MLDRLAITSALNFIKNGNGDFLFPTNSKNKIYSFIFCCFVCYLVNMTGFTKIDGSILYVNSMVAFSRMTVVSDYFTHV